MQYTTIGCTFGFFCIPLILLLMVPLDGWHPVNLNISQDDARSYSDLYGPDFPQTKDYRLSFQWIWAHYLDDVNSCERNTRETVRGYRRITAENVLEHETRQEICDVIRRNPGISLSTLAELSRCNESTLRYHLYRIEKEKFITVYPQGRVHHYFENHRRYSVEEQKLLSRSSSGQSGKIIKMIYERPGITRKEIAESLGVTSPTVTRMVNQLAQEEIIHLVKEGKYTRHFPMRDLPPITMD